MVTDLRIRHSRHVDKFGAPLTRTCMMYLRDGMPMCAAVNYSMNKAQAQQFLSRTRTGDE